MTKATLAGFLALCLFNVIAHADSGNAVNEPFPYREGAGFGLGAVLGGLVAGPPGALIGAAGGIWLGDRDVRKDERIAGLESEVAIRHGEVDQLNRRLADLQQQFGAEMQKVSARNRLSSLEQLSEGVSLSVYFRTGSVTLEDESLPRIDRLADFLRQFPEVRLLVEGHADQRGDEEYNRQLALGRARTVETALISAGIEPGRVMTHSWGESQARAQAADRDGAALDRRVTVTLTLDTQI